MIRQAVNIDWNDWGLGIPAFMTIIFMPLAYSIADGIGAGFLSHVFIRLVQGSRQGSSLAHVRGFPDVPHLLRWQLITGWMHSKHRITASHEAGHLRAGIGTFGCRYPPCSIPLPSYPILVFAGSGNTIAD